MHRKVRALIRGERSLEVGSIPGREQARCHVEQACRQESRGRAEAIRSCTQRRCATRVCNQKREGPTML